MWVRMWGRIISPGDHGIIIHVCLTPSEKVLLDDEERVVDPQGRKALATVDVYLLKGCVRGAKSIDNRETKQTGWLGWLEVL